MQTVYQSLLLCISKCIYLFDLDEPNSNGTFYICFCENLCVCHIGPVQYVLGVTGLGVDQSSPYQEIVWRFDSKLPQSYIEESLALTSGSQCVQGPV